MAGPASLGAGEKEQKIMIKARLFSFLLNEDGSIALDWMALIAATLMVGLLGAHIIGQSTANVSVDLAAALRAAGVTGPTFEQVSQVSSNPHRSSPMWLKRS